MIHYPITIDEAEIVYWCAMASKLAYCDETEIEQELRNSWNLEIENYRYFFDKKTDTQAFAFSTDKSLVITFRGTEKDKLKDWLTDLHALMTRLPWGRLHDGFLHAYNQVKADIIQTIKDFRKEDQSLFITGHSLGGALALYLSYELFLMKDDSMSTDYLYTYAQPAVGNRKFITALDRILPIQRVVHEYDIVPVLPFFMRCLPYVQSSGDVLILTDDEGYMLDTWSNKFDDFKRIVSHLSQSDEKLSHLSFIENIEGSVLTPFFRPKKHQKKLLEFKKASVINLLKGISFNHDMATYIKKIKEEILDPLSLENPSIPF